MQESIGFKYKKWDHYINVFFHNFYYWSMLFLNFKVAWIGTSQLVNCIQLHVAVKD